MPYIHTTTISVTMIHSNVQELKAGEISKCIDGYGRDGIKPKHPDIVVSIKLRTRRYYAARTC